MDYVHSEETLVLPYNCTCIACTSLNVYVLRHRLFSSKFSSCNSETVNLPSLPHPSPPLPSPRQAVSGSGGKERYQECIGLAQTILPIALARPYTDFILPEGTKV